MVIVRRYRISPHRQPDHEPLDPVLGELTIPDDFSITNIKATTSTSGINTRPAYKIISTPVAEQQVIQLASSQYVSTAASAKFISTILSKELVGAPASVQEIVSASSLAPAALLASTGICLGWPAGTNVLILATVTLIAAGAIAQRSTKNVQTRHLLDPLNLTIVWSALSLPFLVLGLSKLMPILFWLLLSTLMLGLINIWSLIAHRLQLLGAIAVVGLLIGSAVILSSQQLSFRKLQVRLC